MLPRERKKNNYCYVRCRRKSGEMVLTAEHEMHGEESDPDQLLPPYMYRL